jgi:hypothetical protein
VLFNNDAVGSVLRCALHDTVAPGYIEQDIARRWPILWPDDQAISVEYIDARLLPQLVRGGCMIVLSSTAKHPEDCPQLFL